MLHADDQLVLTWERNKDHSSCFKSQYHLSRECLNERFYRRTEDMFGGKKLVNWAMGAMPRHRLFYRVLETIVDSVRSQYLHNPIQYFGKSDFHSKWIFCTTGPDMMTPVAREVFAEQDLLEQEHAAVLHDPATTTTSSSSHAQNHALAPGDANFTFTYTLYARDFSNFGGIFKPISTEGEHVSHEQISSTHAA